jgi:NAD-dependent SIR2 family protein deacetylase
MARTARSTQLAADNGARPTTASVSDLEALHGFARQHPRWLVLTGAGASTASGIPAYRDRDGRWTRRAPIDIRAFLQSHGARRRYWHRSLVGWPLLATARPNAAHRALARLESLGRVGELVTQNVDGLHQQAGTARLIELHGNAHRVVCLGCGAAFSRASIQRSLAAANPRFASAEASRPTPDGDADPDPIALETFQVPACGHCGGTLKPDVVFFGENVPRERVCAARAALEHADALLVVGSSLAVYSGYRFCEWAVELRKPIAAINFGCTRADALFAVKIEQPCGTALTALVERLCDAAR